MAQDAHIFLVFLVGRFHLLLLNLCHLSITFAEHTGLTMVRRYQQIHRLGNVQDDIITQVAFSPSGTFIATASLDRKVCLWRVQGGQLLYMWSGDSAILCLIWFPGRDNAMLCGTQNGNLVILTVTSVSPRCCHYHINAVAPHSHC